MSLPLKSHQAVTAAEALDERDAISIPSELLRTDDSIDVHVDELEWGVRFKDGSSGGYLYCTITNKSGRTLVLANAGGVVEWSPNGKDWYSIFYQNYQSLTGRGIFYSMGYAIEFGHGEDNYLQEGEPHSATMSFCLDPERERDPAFPELPDGNYRVIFRICEYAEPEALFHGTAELEEYGWYAAEFNIRDEKLS